MEPVHILCTGDLHLGRFPSRVPSSNDSLRVEHVWQEAVRSAIRHGVEAVVLTGDLVDENNQYFEAIGALRRGVSELCKAGISVFAVAGNHDFAVLPRLCDQLDGGLTLLGRRGEWQTAVIRKNGRAAVRLVGWSFPTRYHGRSPLENFPPLDDDIPTIGIVHGDLDSVSSRYAPILPSHCAEMPVAAWLMGHIHMPQKRPHRDGCILYPGSLQPLDPSERGVHGPWIVGIEASGVVEAHQLDLATVDYAVVDVDISSATDYEGIKPIVEQACYDYLMQAENERESIQHVTLRLRLTGRTALNAEIARSKGELTELTVEAERIVGTVDGVHVATRPVHDLERIAGSSPPGEVARMLLAMESGDFSEEQRRLLDRCVEQIGQIRSSSAYAGSPDEGADPRERAKEILYRQGLALLDQLEDQKAPLQTPEQASVPEQ